MGTAPFGGAVERAARAEDLATVARPRLPHFINLRRGGRLQAAFVYSSHVDERQFFTEKPEQRPARFQCPRCRRTGDFTIRWIRRTKKTQLPPGANERDRALFAKSKDHLIRVDDDVTCKACGKRFEIPSHRALIFLEELEGLPQDVEDEEESQ